MKNLKKIRSPFKKTLVLFFFSVLLCGIPVPGIAQEKSIGELKKEATDAKKEAEGEIKKNN